MKTNRNIYITLGVVFFTVYFVCAARPIPRETVLIPRWLVSLESGNPVLLGDGSFRAPDGQWDERSLMPFELSGRFGYFDREGRFSINQAKRYNISLSAAHWAEYGDEPDQITINSSNRDTLAVINDPRGYPFFLDGRTFLVGSDQNAISQIDDSGGIQWVYDFASPLICVDAAAGLVLTGSFDGIIGVLDSSGRQVFSFEPGGSRYAIILGCAISRDGSKLALISGINAQRFLLLERFGTTGGDYKVVYHEFLASDFRRPVFVSFIDDDRWVVFEREGGIGFFDIGSRQTGKVDLKGEVIAVDGFGGQNLVFFIVSLPSGGKELVGIKLPDKVIIEAPFKSDDVFLGRMDSRLFIGGGQTLVSFDVDKR